MGKIQRFFGRGLEPREGGGVGFPPGGELQHGPGKIHSLHLGCFEVGKTAVLVLRPEAQAAAGTQPPGPPGSLVGGSAADAGQLQPIDPAAGVEP